MNRDKHSRAVFLIVTGLLLALAGLAITLVTYDHATQSGGHYVLAWGPIVVGVIRIFRGLVHLGDA